MSVEECRVWTIAVFIGCALVALQAKAQECGSPVDFGFAADSFLEDDPGADCGIVIQGEDIVAITNYNFLVFDRDGNVNLQRSRTPEDFFADLELVFTADAFCVFDPLANRWFILSLATNATLGMAVSRTAVLDFHDPERWWGYEWDPPGVAIDYPSMSVGEEQVFLTYVRQFSGPGLATILYLDKADLLDGGEPPDLTTFSITSISGQDDSYHRDIGCVREYEEINSGYGYFITDSHVARTGTNSMVRLYALNTADDSLEHFDLTVPEYRSCPRTIPIPDNATLDHTSGHDFKWPIYRDGSLWAAHDIGVAGTEQCQIQWYEIKLNGWPVTDLDPTLEQSGVVEPPDSSTSVFYPAIHVDDEGNMAIAYNQSSSSQHPAIYRRIRKWYDDDGELRAPLLLKQSTGSPSGQNARWADFSCMEADPDHPGVMWSHLEWFEPTETRKTWLTRTDLNQSMPLFISPTTTPIMRGTYVTLSVKGAGPGNQVRWYYSTSGCGSTYIPALDATLDIDTAVLIGSSMADANGDASKSFTVPNDFPLGVAHLQAAEAQNTSAVLEVTVSSQ